MAWCLSFHARYRCRHAGACCAAEWQIPFEDGTVAARSADGSCTFYDGTSRLCSIHHAAGHDALPLTCRMFPRRVLHDARGTFISLSHFCPTAAALLFDEDGDTTIVEAPAALTFGGRDDQLDGLDARSVWPPMLRPGMLMDLDSYAAWERRAIDILTSTHGTADEALAALERATSRIIDWSPAEGSLVDRVAGRPEGLHDDRTPRPVAQAPSPDDVAQAFRPAAGQGRAERAVKRWLAARLFGGWIAYQGDGLAATLRYLRHCLDTFDHELAADGDPREAVRRSDLRLLHT